MPLGAIAQGIFSVILGCILQIVLEGMIKGAGCVILRSGYFTKQENIFNERTLHVHEARRL
ncbi:MAG: hypothetical protein D3911_05045 [Candidatus Electrothrix sp. AW3_4]|nr:hypothetical protein [Candidatus Electrothrix gigas]